VVFNVKRKDLESALLAMILEFRAIEIVIKRSADGRA